MQFCNERFLVYGSEVANMKVSLAERFINNFHVT